MSVAAEHLEQHRSALTGHCYRTMGSVVDADDAVQETMMRAWRSLERFDGRASLRTWLYRTATNVCLDMLSERSRPLVWLTQLACAVIRGLRFFQVDR